MKAQVGLQVPDPRQGQGAQAANAGVPIGTDGTVLKQSLTGGAERDRTADLVNAIHALSQLSYSPVQVVRPWGAGRKAMRTGP